MAAISRRGQGGRIYIIIRVRACCCGKCALNPPTAQPIPRRSPPLAPAQRHALPEHFRSPTQPRRTPAGCAMHARRPHNPFPAEDLRSSTHSDTPFPSTSAPPRSADSHPQAARCIPRRPHDPFPAEDFLSPPHSDTPVPSTSAPPRSADARPRSPDARPQAARCTPRSPHNPFPAAPRCPPSVPLRAQKNGTAQCMCDAECFGRPSLRSVVWVGEPRAVRRRCGALACRRGA